MDAAKPVNGIRGWALRAAGMFFLGLAAIGVVLPIMPSTCFLLVSAACFARSSPRLYQWLHENRVFGKLLRDYRDHRMIPMTVKVTSIAVLWITIGITFFAVPIPVVRVIVVAVAAGVTWHVVSLRHRAAPEHTASVTATD